MNFEWDPAKAAATSRSMASHSKRQPPHSAIRSRSRYRTQSTPRMRRRFVSSARGSRHGASAETMSKKPKRTDDMREEYDFSEGVRGKYSDRFREGSNVVVLEPDVAAEFDSDQAVNRALRAYIASKKSKKGAA